MAGVYLLLGVLWIVFSDRALETWVGDPATVGSLQTAKGVVFVLLSAIVVAVLVYRELRGRRESEEQIRTLAEQDLAGVSVVQDSRFLFVNPRLAEIFGYEVDELVRSSIRVGDLIVLDDRETVSRNLRRPLEGEIGDVSYRYSGIRKDGEIIQVDVHGRRIEWNGEPAVMSLHLDVTEEHRLRESARRTQRMETLGQLTGAVAHDFNNLLTAIITPLDLCEEHLDAADPVGREVKEAKENAQRAAALTRQLLSFSRGRLIQLRAIDLNELVLRAEPMLRRLTPSWVEVELDLESDLPAVEVDPSHFDQVLLNLITNAVDAVGDKGKIGIRTRSEERDERAFPDVVLEVSDDGEGMDPETRERIFDPFFTTRKSGTGLGLSTVHGIVKQEGGEISVASVPGGGTRFTIHLPGSGQDPEALAEAAEEEEEGDRAQRFEGARILVVDDQAPVLRVTVRALERFGFAVDAAADAGEALEIARKKKDRIDLLLTDFGLPDVDGASLARQIEDLIPSVVIVYMSGYSGEEVLEKMARTSAGDYLEKPFSVRGLLGAVRKALDEDPPNARRA